MIHSRKSSENLISLIMYFYEYWIDNDIIEFLGHHLLNVCYLDIHGNSSILTLIGWFDN